MKLKNNNKSKSNKQKLYSKLNSKINKNYNNKTQEKFEDEDNNEDKKVGATTFEGLRWAGFSGSNELSPKFSGNRFCIVSSIRR
mgnify:CR=1 FL=1